MSSVLSSQGVALATAMAVSGTVILLAFRLQKSTIHFTLPPSSDEGEKRRRKKKKKKVHFAEDVVDPIGNGDEYRKLHIAKLRQYSNSLKKDGEVQEMPANRVALYNGILRDRVLHKVTYSC